MLHGGFRDGRRRRIQNVLDWSHARNRFLCEDAQGQGKRPGKLAVEINWAAAHASDDAGMFDFGAFQLNEDDGLFGAHEIVQHAEDFQVEFLNLVPGKDGIGVALHAGPDLAKRKNLRRLLGFQRAGDQAQSREERKESESGTNAKI